MSHEGLRNPPSRANWPELLADLVDVLSAHFRRRGTSSEAAPKEAQAAVLTLAKYFGGRQIYLPQGKQIDRALRDQEIYRRFDGTNKRALAEEFRLSERMIEIIVKDQMERSRQKTEEPSDG